MTYQRIFILLRILSLILLVGLIYSSSVWAMVELVNGMRLKLNMTTGQHITTMVSILVLCGCTAWCMKLILDRLVNAGVTLMNTTQTLKSEE